LALAAAVGVFIPQADSVPVAIQGQWLATLQGRYGRWTGLLSDLGFFHITHALWLQVLLVLAVYQGLVATAEACGQACQWMCPAAEPSPRLPPPLARERGVTHLPCTLDQGVARAELAFQPLGYYTLVARDEESAFVEVMRHPWLTLGRPLAHGGVALVCLAGLLAGRLDWQEGPVTLSSGQTYGLQHVPGMLVHLKKTGLARQSSQSYSWLSLRRGDQVWCQGVVFRARALNCGGMHIRQDGTEPALHIVGHDRRGHPVAIQPLRGGEPAAAEVVLNLPHYVSDGYAVLPEQGLMLHFEVSPDDTRPTFRLQAYRGQQSAPLLQRDIADRTSLALEDLTLALTPTRVPSFRVLHHPTRPLRLAGLGLALAGLVVGLALSPFHAWIQLEEREGEVCLRLWHSLPRHLHTVKIREIESRIASLSFSGTAT